MGFDKLEWLLKRLSALAALTHKLAKKLWAFGPGAFWLFGCVFLAGSQAGKARDCYSRCAQVRILPGQPGSMDELESKARYAATGSEIHLDLGGNNQGF